MIKKNKGYIIFFYVLAFISMIIATFKDLDINIALNNPDNPFAVWFWCTGEMPARLICPFAGVVVLLCAKKAFSKIIGILIELGGSAYLGYHIADYFFTKDNNQIIFGIVYGIGFGVFLLFLSQFITVPDKIKKPLLALAITGIVVMLFELATIEGLKIFWGRERMRALIEEGSYNNFTPWYKPQGITSSNEFKSFPSGHTAGAGLSFLAMLLPSTSDKWNKRDTMCFIVPLIYTVIVAFTRMVMGAHFLSDVTAGAIVSFTIVVVAMATLDKINSKNKFFD